MRKLLEIKNLKKYFYTGKTIKGKREAVCAIDDISFHINKKEVLGLVGESGCGKTTVGKTVLRIHEPTNGRIIFDGHDITDLNRKEMLKFRKRMMIIYQDPYGSLDPRKSIGKAIMEPMIVQKTYIKSEMHDRVVDLMKKVGLNTDQINRYPHEFSGGQRQRIGIARALAGNPEFIVADESVSALDVSIQAQILNLLQRLKEEYGLTLLFITHDLSVTKHISDRVAVMYLGKIVEKATKAELFSNPLHPYTKALLSAVPNPDPTLRKKNDILLGDVPSPLNPPKGCAFHTRCKQAQSKCKIITPEFINHSSEHSVACHF